MPSTLRARQWTLSPPRQRSHDAQAMDGAATTRLPTQPFRAVIDAGAPSGTLIFLMTPANWLPSTPRKWPCSTQAASAGVRTTRVTRTSASPTPHSGSRASVTTRGRCGGERSGRTARMPRLSTVCGVDFTPRATVVYFTQARLATRSTSGWTLGALGAGSGSTSTTTIRRPPRARVVTTYTVRPEAMSSVGARLADDS